MLWKVLSSALTIGLMLWQIYQMVNSSKGSQSYCISLSFKVNNNLKVEDLVSEGTKISSSLNSVTSYWRALWYKQGPQDNFYLGSQKMTTNPSTNSEGTLFEKERARRRIKYTSSSVFFSYRRGIQWHTTVQLRRWMEIREGQIVIVGDDCSGSGSQEACSIAPMCFTSICYKTVII